MCRVAGQIHCLSHRSYHDIVSLHLGLFTGQLLTLQLKAVKHNNRIVIYLEWHFFQENLAPSTHSQQHLGFLWPQLTVNIDCWWKSVSTLDIQACDLLSLLKLWINSEHAKQAFLDPPAVFPQKQSTSKTSKESFVMLMSSASSLLAYKSTHRFKGKLKLFRTQCLKWRRWFFLTNYGST